MSRSFGESGINIKLIVNEPQWRDVFTIPQGSKLQKGRHGYYHDIVAAAGAVRERYGCYSWGSNMMVHYCGSFTQDYARGSFRSNLHGRMHNYLQNHRIKSTGHKNTNLMVFERINEALAQGDIILRHFLFSSLTVGENGVDFHTFSNDAILVRAVEELLICSYRRIDQCGWNRT